MRAIESVRRVRPETLFLALSSEFILAGGFIHLHEWLDVYRRVPATAPGAAVVRVGLPLNAAASLVIVIALVLVVRRRGRLTQPVIFGALAFQVASLATLIASRVASAFGWSEPTWTSGAEQTRAVEVAAIAALLILAALSRHEPTGGHSDLDDADPHTANGPDRDRRRARSRYRDEVSTEG